MKKVLSLILSLLLIVSFPLVRTDTSFALASDEAFGSVQGTTNEADDDAEASATSPGLFENGETEAVLEDCGEVHMLNSQGSQVVPNGVYRLSMGSNLYLTTSNDNLSHVTVGTQISAFPQQLNQLWKIYYLGDGYYSIRPMCQLDMCLGRYGTGVRNVTVGTNDTSSSLSPLYKWKITGSNSSFRLESASYSGQYLCVSGTSVYLGGASNVYWSPVNMGYSINGVLLRNTKSWMEPGESVTFSASVYSSSTINQNVIWSSSNTNVATVNRNGVVEAISGGTATITAKSTVNSNWFGTFTVNVAEIPSGTYFITSKASTDKAVDIYNRNTTSGESIHQQNYDGNTAQRWIFELQHDGYYTIKSLYSNLYLSVKNNSSSNGAEVVQYAYSGADGQKWKVTKTDSGAYKIQAKTAGSQNLCLMKGTYIFYPNKLVHKAYTNNSNYDDEWNIFNINSIYGSKPFRELTDREVCEINCFGYSMFRNETPIFTSVLGITYNQFAHYYCDFYNYIRTLNLSSGYDFPQTVKTDIGELTKAMFEAWLDSEGYIYEYEEDFTGNGDNRILRPNQYRVVLRTGLHLIRGELRYDYHFWYQEYNGTWANKHGNIYDMSTYNYNDEEISRIKSNYPNYFNMFIPEQLQLGVTPFSPTTSGWDVNEYSNELQIQTIYNFYDGPIYSYIITVTE